LCQAPVVQNPALGTSTATILHGSDRKFALERRQNVRFFGLVEFEPLDPTCVERRFL